MMSAAREENRGSISEETALFAHTRNMLVQLDVPKTGTGFRPPLSKADGETEHRAKGPNSILRAETDHVP